MSEPIIESLTDHFARTWDMLLEAARLFPEEEWCVATDERMQPARVVYHRRMVSSTC